MTLVPAGMVFADHHGKGEKECSCNKKDKKCKCDSKKKKCDCHHEEAAAEPAAE
jgi:hypothetical protein